MANQFSLSECINSSSQVDWFPSLIKLYFRYDADKLLKGENQSTSQAGVSLGCIIRETSR